MKSRQSVGTRVVYHLCLVTVLGTAVILGMGVPVQGQGLAVRAEAVVIVNSASANYQDFSWYVQPYLDHFGVPYTVLDIATTVVSAEIGDYALIVIGHKRLDTDHQYLDTTEQGWISAAVSQGAGLVNFDGVLADAGYAPLYQYIQTVYGFGYPGSVTATGVTVYSDVPVGDYIVGARAADQAYTLHSGIAAVGVSVPTGRGSTLATIGAYPLLVGVEYGQGRAVQWTSYDWMQASMWGYVRGFDDLVWRGLVWAARKPFVLQGLPPFVTMRVDDGAGPYWWVDIANQYGLRPWIGLFLDDQDASDISDIRRLVAAGLLTVSIHARTTTQFFYFDHQSGSNLSDAVVNQNFVDGTAWHTQNQIPISRYVVPHYYEIGTNAFAGLRNWGVQFIGMVMAPGHSYGSERLSLGPFSRHETACNSDCAEPLYYADYLSVAGHPEFNGQFFVVNTEIRDNAGYEWYPSNDVAGTIERGVTQLKRALDGMELPVLFTHEYYIQSISESNWSAILSGVTGGIGMYQPIYVTMDYAAQYVRAMYTSQITGSLYDPVRRMLDTTLSGAADMPTQFYLFTEQNGVIDHSLVDVPAFTGSIVVPTPVDIPVPAPQSQVTWAPAYQNASPITVTWVATPALAPLAEVRLWYRLDSDAWTTTSFSSTGSITSGTFSFTPSGNGTYDFATVAQDTLGGSEANPSGHGDATTIYDTVAPTVIVQSPVSGAVLTSTLASVPVTGTAVDATSGITEVLATSSSSWVRADGLNPWAYTWSLPSADDVVYTLRARSTDRAGNVGTATGTMVTVDTVAPSAAVPSAHSSPWVTSSVTFTWTASSDGAGIAGYELQITNTQGYNARFATANPRFTFAQAYAEGVSYYARVRATDANGNTGAWSASSLAIVPDLTYPVIASPAIESSTSFIHVSVSGVALFYTNTMGLPIAFTVRGTASDTLSGLDRATFSRAFAQTPPNDTTPDVFGGTYTVNPGATGNGLITATVYDRAGNAAVQVYSYTLDGTPPASIASAPVYATSSPITVTWVATDTQSGVYSTTLWYRKELTGSWQAYQTTNVSSGTFSFAPPLGDGLYLFATVAADNLGNVEPRPTVSETQTSYDTRVPQSQVTWAPEYKASSSITMTWMATPFLASLVEVRLWYRLNGGIWTQTSISSTGSISSGVLEFTPSGDGVYDFAMVARDALDRSGANPTSSGDASTAYDTQIAAPQGMASLPATWTNTNVFTVTWNNPPDLSGIVGAYYKLDAPPSAWNDGVWRVGSGLRQMVGITVSAEGEHTIWVWLADRAGNIDHTAAARAELGYDSSIQAPSGLVAAPLGWTNDNSFAVTWSNPTDLSGIIGGYYKLDAPPDTWNDGIWVPGGNLGQITNVTVSGEGTHTLYLWLRDAAGNVNQALREATSLQYDSSPPADVTVVVPTETSTTEFLVSWSAQDALSGIGYYRVEYSSTMHNGWQLWLTSTTALAAPFSAPVKTHYTFRVTAYDVVGNSAQAQAEVTVGIHYTYLPLVMRGGVGASDHMPAMPRSAEAPTRTSMAPSALTGTTYGKMLTGVLSSQWSRPRSAWPRPSPSAENIGSG